jgi:hypothetical protein
MAHFIRENGKTKTQMDLEEWSTNKARFTRANGAKELSKDKGLNTELIWFKKESG